MTLQPFEDQGLALLPLTHRHERLCSYRKRRIRRNILRTNPIEGQVRCCQIWGIWRNGEENHMSRP